MFIHLFVCVCCELCIIIIIYLQLYSNDTHYISKDGALIITNVDDSAEGRYQVQMTHKRLGISYKSNDFYVNVIRKLSLYFCVLLSIYAHSVRIYYYYCCVVVT